MTIMYRQSSKDSTSPMSETCKIQTGQVKFQDRKPDWACKIVESKLKKYWTKKLEFLSLKVNRGIYADPFNQETQMGATVEDVSCKLIISKFPNGETAHALAKKSSGLCNFFRASKICLLPALWACDLKNFLRRLYRY